MKRTFQALLLTGLSLDTVGTAEAEPRYNPRKMSCEAVQDAIRGHGAVTLRYTSTRVKNLPLYNRYVQNTSYCDMTEVAVSASVPTIDRERCPVKLCEHRDVERHRFPWLMND